MKEQWLKFANRVDALTLRERVLAFATAAAAIVSVAWFAGLGPMIGQYTTLRSQVSQQQNNLLGLDGEIEQKVKAWQADPDAANRERLAAVRAQSAQLGENLRTMQRGLVAPERMAALLDTILRSNGRLELVSMKTLPAGPLDSLLAPPAEGANAAPGGEGQQLLAKVTNPDAAQAAAAGNAKPAAAAPKADSLLFRHGVEVAVRGNYLDMIDYMNALEALPTQLFWGAARLEVEEYPTARLTLTLYTLSLDAKWMKL